MNKIDLVAGLNPAIERAGAECTVWLSVRRGVGIDLLRQALLAAVGWHAEPEGVYLARERHLRALAVAKEQISSASTDQPEILAEHLRLAHDALVSITGEFTSDDLLGEIFQRFCLGK